MNGNNVSLLRALATTLLTEIDSLGEIDANLLEDANFSLNEKVREFEIKLIKLALTKTGGNQRRAAQMLGIKCSTLHNKIKTLNIEYLKFGNSDSNIESRMLHYAH